MKTSMAVMLAASSQARTYTCDSQIALLAAETKTAMTTYNQAIASSAKFQDPNMDIGKNGLWNPSFFQQNWKNEGDIDGWEKWYNQPWKRPDEMTGQTKPYNMWGLRGIQPTAISQGGLGDCWFLATGAAMAEWPARVQKMIPRFDVNKGIVQFNFWDRGFPVTFNIDDRMPNNNGRPVFSQRSKNQAWWGPLYEKAGAKFYGVYADLIGGNFGEAYDNVAGRPFKLVQLASFNADALWKILVEYDANNYLFYAGNQR